MDPLTAIAERRIQEAIERGEFDDLPGKGKPLDLGEDDRLEEDPLTAKEISSAVRRPVLTWPGGWASVQG